MGTPRTPQKVLAQALAVVGDEAELARRLGVPMMSLVAWLLGEARCPTDVVLGAVRISLEHTEKQVKANRALFERIKRRYRPE